MKCELIFCLNNQLSELSATSSSQFYFPVMKELFVAMLKACSYYVSLLICNRYRFIVYILSLAAKVNIVYYKGVTV